MSSEASKCSSISLVIPSAILIKIVFTGPSSAWNALAYLVEQALTVILQAITSSFFTQIFIWYSFPACKSPNRAFTGVINTFLFRWSWMSFIIPILSFSIKESKVFFLSCKSFNVQWGPNFNNLTLFSLLTYVLSLHVKSITHT